MNQLDTKLQKLRAIYVQPDDQQLLDEIEKNLRRKIVESDLAAHPVVQVIIADAKKKAAEISFMLANDRTLSDVQRQTLFNKREVAEFYLERFGVKHQAEAIE